MAGKFFFPTHWADLGPEAFSHADDGHTQHGFSSAFLARMDDRDRYLEDAIGGSGLGGFTFEFIGPLVISVSNALPAPEAVSIAGFDFTFNVQSTSDVVVQYVLDGNVVGTTDIPANTSVYNAPFDSPINMTAHVDTLQVRIITPGTGGAGLVAVPYSS
jgi:hypothetical protein